MGRVGSPGGVIAPFDVEGKRVRARTMAGTLDENSWRVLPPKPYDSLTDYVEAGGGAGLAAVGSVEPITIIEEFPR